ncbi:MAG TPA: integration host factor [Firmicutes bacterium]|nr:integration host factor [Bacillota bacterium]
MALPKLTPEEKKKALLKAQEMRSRRAVIRENLKSGKMTLREILSKTDDEVIAKMRVAYLLQSLPQVGKVTSRKIMEEIGIHESRRVQGLGKRQIGALLERF